MKIKNTILVVDDIAMNRDVLSIILQDRYVILEAEDGEQALCTLAEHQDDVAAILLDLDMPKKNGYEVLAELKDKGICAHMPVLILTSDSGRAAESKCLSSGAYDFIVKPFCKELIEKHVCNAIEFFAEKQNLNGLCSKH